MGKSQDLIESLDKKLSISRRGFVKGAVAAGAAAAVYGCSKDDGGEVIYTGGGSGSDPVYTDDLYYTKNPTYRYGSSAHNCGGRCIIKAQVTADGRIVRFLTDETKYAYDGTLIDNDHRNTTQSRACSRCRAYKGRLYHPGRLKYPLKQTVKRGDINGFKRISWAEAFKDIAERLRAVQGKYGPTAFHSLYACGNIASSFQGGGYTGIFEVNDFGTISPALRLLGGCTGYTSDYSFHQGSYMGGYGTAYSGMINMAPTPNDMATFNTDFVMWGSNIPTTHNPKAFAWVKSIEDMKKRGGKVTFIGPELSEVGISQADEWIQIKPYTDTALILGMLYHMIDNTLNGKTPALDLNYIDTMVYGFFDSPAHYIAHIDKQYSTDSSVASPSKDAETVVNFDGTNPYSSWNNNGTTVWIKNTDTTTLDPDPDPGTAKDVVVTVEPAADLLKYYSKSSRWTDGTSYTYSAPVFRKVEAVPAGHSLSAYVMGDDTRLANMPYGSDNYMAKFFTENEPGITRNKAVSSYTVTANSKYKYKASINTPKTPKWASEITGVSEERIKQLAEFYLNRGIEGNPVYNEWAGGQLKQNDGCITLYAIQTLLILTKNWGLKGTGIANNTMGVQKTEDPNQINASQLRPASWGDPTQIKPMAFHPKPSVTQWHNAIKFAFGDQLKANGYDPNIPDWKNAGGLGKPQYQGKTGEAYFDDGGVKALVSRSFLKPVDKANILNKNEMFTKEIEVTMPDGSKKTVTHNYYKYDGMQAGDEFNPNNAKFAGFRFIINSAGNIPINQHANPIDSARMYEALPTYGYGEHTADIADAFYLVTFDNFMSPSARYSDYVLPAKTTWEQEDFVAIENSGNLYIDSVIPGPGESMSSWDFAREWIKAYGGAAEAAKFTGIGSASSFKDVVEKVYNEKIKTDSASPFYGKDWEEFLEKPISHAKPNMIPPTELEKNSIRVAYENYVADYAAGRNTGPFFPGITTADWSNASGVFGFCNDPYDTGGEGFAETESCPQQTGRFQVYSGTLVWRYENMFSKWHGYLPKERQGQINKDEEGDPIVYPIPMYFDYEDHFRVAYGLSSNDELAGRYLLTTTHDRFRAHSSQAENPYLRELTHRIRGGELYSGNDYGSFAISNNPNGDDNEFPVLNALIGEDGLPLPGAEKKASYTDIWVNSEDFADYNDGDLVKVENEIGSVYCTIRKTNRCVKGFVGLHQGCWFDPRTIGGQTVDVGGCCNTLMPSTPSRMDHGNGVQSAMVKISKVNG